MFNITSFHIISVYVARITIDGLTRHLNRTRRPLVKLGKHLGLVTFVGVVAVSGGGVAVVAAVIEIVVLANVIVAVVIAMVAVVTRMVAIVIVVVVFLIVVFVVGYSGSVIFSMVLLFFLNVWLLSR